MTNDSALQQRYLRDPLPVRLGGLAANLARVQSFSDNPAHGKAVARLLEESAWFIEWTTADAPIDTQVELVACQRALAGWRLAWDQIWPDAKRRSEVAERAGAWSQRFLGRSGLLQAESTVPTGHRA